jgi:dipeptidyl aminopeptidase/acylaminoacyl peptidase
MLKRFLPTLGAALFIIAGTLAAIFWARGYRPNLKNGQVQGTGLLAANSAPTGAQVFVNDKLTTATNNTVNLDPGNYKVKITKEGYLPWEKNLELQKELVVQTNALLFPSAPDLKALTYNGVLNPLPAPDGQKMAFLVASASASAKNGLYVMDLGNRTLSFRQEILQIARLESFAFTDSAWLWSPDSSQILVWQTNKQGVVLTSILLDTNKLNEVLPDQTKKFSALLADWEEEVKLKNKERFDKLPEKLQALLGQNTDRLYWSPDEKKILYTATASATLNDNLIAPLPASNTQPQSRQLEPGKIYVYDTKEDKNFEVGTANSLLTTHNSQLTTHFSSLTTQYTPIFTQNLQWFPDSQHLIEAQKEKIIIKEYDNTNAMNVYAGPLNPSDGLDFAFVYPWPDAGKLVIVTALNQDLPPNFYAVNLK